MSFLSDTAQQLVSWINEMKRLCARAWMGGFLPVAWALHII